MAGDPVIIGVPAIVGEPARWDRLLFVSLTGSLARPVAGLREAVFRFRRRVAPGAGVGEGATGDRLADVGVDAATGVPGASGSRSPGGTNQMTSCKLRRAGALALHDKPSLSKLRRLYGAILTFGYEPILPYYTPCLQIQGAPYNLTRIKFCCRIYKSDRRCKTCENENLVSIHSRRTFSPLLLQHIDG